MKVAVLGAGKGGHAAAGHFKLKDYEVALWNRKGHKIDRLKEKPEISLEGKLEGRVTLDLVTDNIEEAIKNAQIISVMTTSDAYDSIAKNLAPYLNDGQMIILNCGGIGGTLLFLNTVRELGQDAQISVGETDTCVYGCKVPEIGTSHIKSIKNKMYFTSIPISAAAGLLESIRPIYPQFEHIQDPLATGFWDVTCFHTAGMVLNEDRIKKKEDFNFYIEGITPEIGEFMEKLDAERVAVAKALGIPTENAMEWLNSAYGVNIADLYTMLQNNEPYKHNAPAPKTFQHRYLLEEIPTKFVPQIEIARTLGIPQPLTEEMTREAEKLTGTDLWAKGRTLSKLGLTEKDIRNYSQQGLHPYMERNDLTRYTAAKFQSCGGI
jgi:opine dehydrogenase